jgi:hypothetical protein
VASGVTREAMSRVTLGMQDSEVRSLLGSPLSAYVRSQSGVETTTLIYAVSGGWRVLGMASNVVAKGPGCFLEFKSGKLTSAMLFDSNGNAFCACIKESCPEGWATACLPALPQ